VTALKLATLGPASDTQPQRDDDRSLARPLAELIAPGRLVELCGAAQMSTAVTILAHAQREGETAAWIQPARGSLYPPDLAAAGVDVEALVVIHVPDTGAMSGASGQCRAAELLLRSGGFGLLVIDFASAGQNQIPAEPTGSTAWQGRLLGLARQHEARVLLLRKDARESLGPLVGMRVASRVERVIHQDDPSGFSPRTGSFEIRHEVLKNKSGGPLEPAAIRIRGPWGLG
jgi:recA bacterial DNA recombination protein